MKFISMTGLIVFALLLSIFCPLAFIWAVNTLFSIHIAYNFVNWLAAAILYYSFSRPGRFSSSNKNK
jgi:hypothetical protein